MIAGTDNYVNVPVEAATVLGGALAMVVLFLVVFLYINRKWCYGAVGGYCCDEPLLQVGKSQATRSLIRNMSEDRRSSTDSETEVMRRLRQPISRDLNQVPHYGTGYEDEEIMSTVVRNVSVPRTEAPLYHSVSVERKTGSSASSASSSTSSGVGGGGGRRGGGAGGGGKYRKLAPSKQDSMDSNHDCIVVLSHEPLYPESPVAYDDEIKPAGGDYNDNIKSQPNEQDLITSADEGLSTETRCPPVLEVALLYDAPMRKMTVHLLQARGIPIREGAPTAHTQVRMLILPSKKQKHKSKIRPGENPQFMESFLLHRVNPEDVNSMGLRVRAYACERMRREKMLGEAVISFAAVDLEFENNLWLSLEPRASGITLNDSTSDIRSLARSDSAGSTASMQHGGVPELLLGLAYNGTTGRLLVEVVKGSHFRHLSLNKAPDTYVKLCLVSSMGQEMGRSKTSTRRGQPNPLFKETFMFQVALFQLNEVTLIVSVYSRRNVKRNSLVGWFSLGQNASGPEEGAHWTDMMQTRAEPLCRWHVLLDS